MGYKIEIAGLGPVKKAKIDSSNNVIIAGPNGSGKSTVARVLYTSIYIDNKRDELKSELEQRFREELVNSICDLFRAIYFELNKNEINIKFFHSYLKFITYDEEYDIPEILEIFPEQKEIIENFIAKNVHDKFNSKNDDYMVIRGVFLNLYNFANRSFVMDNDYLLDVSKKVFNELNDEFSDLFNEDKFNELEGFSEDRWNILSQYEKVKENLFDITSKVESLFEDGSIHRYFMKANFGHDSYNVSKFETCHYDNIYFFDLESNYFRYGDGNTIYDAIYMPSDGGSNSKIIYPFPYFGSIKSVLAKKAKNMNFIESFSIDNFDFEISRLNELVDYFELLKVKKEWGFNEFKFGLKNVDGLINASKLSSGQKMVFALTVLIYALSKKTGKNSKKSIIFIDEPELHLHPMLQLYFGEFLALASKEFGIDFVLVTHSLYIIDAFNVFSKKYNNNINLLDVYVMKEDKKQYSCQKVDKLSEVYNVLLSPYDILDQIEEELSLEQV